MGAILKLIAMIPTLITAIALDIVPAFSDQNMLHIQNERQNGSSGKIKEGTVEAAPFRPRLEAAPFPPRKTEMMRKDKLNGNDILKSPDANMETETKPLGTIIKPQASAKKESKGESQETMSALPLKPEDKSEIVKELERRKENYALGKDRY